MYEEAFEIALQETAIDFKVLLVALALGALGVARVVFGVAEIVLFPIFEEEVESEEVLANILKL